MDTETYVSRCLNEKPINTSHLHKAVSLTIIKLASSVDSSYVNTSGTDSKRKRLQAITPLKHDL
jgi:hypothetical protein